MKIFTPVVFASIFFVFSLQCSQRKPLDAVLASGAPLTVDDYRELSFKEQEPGGLEDHGLMDDGLMAELVTAADELRGSYDEKSVFYSLGQTPAYILKTAQYREEMEGRSQKKRYRSIAFSKHWYDSDGSNEHNLSEDENEKPGEEKVEAYRKYLQRIGFSPRHIARRYKKKEKQTVLVEYTCRARGLASFLALLRDWISETEYGDEIEQALIIHTYPHPRFRYLNELSGFKLTHATTYLDLMVYLSCDKNSKEFDDRLVLHYPHEKWLEQDPNEYQVPKNANRILLHILHYLHTQEKQNGDDCLEKPAKRRRHE